MSTIQELARHLSDAFETRTRDNGETFDALKDGSPDWMTDVCRDAHGGMLPDDWRYRMIRMAAGCIEEGGTDDEAGDCADDFLSLTELTNQSVHLAAIPARRVGHRLRLNHPAVCAEVGRMDSPSARRLHYQTRNDSQRNQP